MQNIIAVIWDFDKTLIDGNMQDPIFEEYHIDKTKFWEKVNALPARYAKEGVKVNADTIYLNQFIKDTKAGIFKGLNNEKLRTFGQKQKYYQGVPEIFKELQRVVEENPKYREYNIRVEHYIVSTGMSAIIEGSAVRPYVEAIWGCDLIEGLDENKQKIISEVGYTIDNTTKTRALFEINKGVPQHPEIDVNAKMSDALRRVAFPNMIYIADGPSDVPAFSVVNKFGGSTFAIYPKGNSKAFRQVEQLREDGRIDMYAEADYRKGTTAYMWLTHKVDEIAARIYKTEKESLEGAVSAAPRHLV